MSQKWEEIPYISPDFQFANQALIIKLFRDGGRVSNSVEN
jgi:hypothetical protein